MNMRLLKTQLCTDPTTRFCFWMRSAALAIGLPMIALLASIPLRSDNLSPFILFYAAISLVAWMEGLWQSFFSLALSLALANYFLIPPYHSFKMSFSRVLGSVLRASVQLLICWLIHSRKRTANTLREQAGLLDISHDCIMVRDADGTIRLWNHGAEEIYGFSAQEAHGRIAQELLQTVFPLPLAEIEALLLKNGRWEGELQHTTRNGAHLTVESRWVMQPSRNGMAPRVMETNQDITERRLQGKALRNNEAFLEQTGRLAGVGGWEIDLATQERIWTAETYHIVGMDPSRRPTMEDVLGLYTAESRPLMVAAIERATLYGEGWDLELGLNRLDGRQIWVRVVGNVEFADGKPVRVVGATQDITARVEERRALEEANLRAAMATASGGIGLFEVDLSSGKVKYDAIMYRLYGLDRDCDVEGGVEFWMRRLHPDDRPALELVLQYSIAGIRPYDIDFRIVWDDGSIHHIKATGKVTCDLNGIPIRIVGTNMDITAAKLAEQALRDQADLLDLSHDGIMVRDFDGVIRFWNHGAEEMYGFAAGEACGKFAQDLLETVFPHPLAEIDADLLQHGRWEGELRHTTRDGKHIVVSSRWVLQLIGDGTASRVMEINEDITERSLQEKALRKSEAFLEQTGKVAGVGGWELDLETKEVFWTTETYRILHTDLSYRPTLKEALDMYPPESQAVLAAAFEKAAADGKGFDHELTLIRFDGQPICVRVMANVKLANGKPARFVGAFQDITERKKAEATLRQTEQMQRLILDHSPIAALLSTGEDQVFVYENPRFIEWFGYPMDKVPKLADWWPLAYPDPEYREWVSSEWNRRVAKSVDNEDEIEPMEVTIACADGTQKYIRVAAKRIREFNFVTFIDLTERKKVEVALQKSEDAYRKLAELVPQLVWKCTPDGLNIYFNRQWVDYTGLTLEESYGTGWNTPFHPDDKAPAWKAWDHSVQTGENYRIDCRLRAADGSYRWFLIKGIPLRDENGAIIEWFGTCTDVDDLKKAEEELVRKTQELMRSNQELDQFAYAASHDLKAPLRVIFNASKWLEEDLEQYLTPSTREDMDLLRRRVVRMEKLLDDLLEYSRIGRTKSEQRVEILTADELMENILGLISLPEGFTVNLSPKLASIQVKRMPLQQVLINLVSNALKHHDKKTGCIEVSVEDLGTKLEFTVRDDGPGIPPEFHEQIFKMFQTLKPRDQVEGSGMGLAMVRKYIEFAGGQIAVESEVGRGSTFRFSWPKQPMEEEPL